MRRDVGRSGPSSLTPSGRATSTVCEQIAGNTKRLRRGGWAVRVWTVGTLAAWDAADMGELRGLIGDEAASVLTDPTVARVAVGLVFDARVSDQLWAGVAVHPSTP